MWAYLSVVGQEDALLPHAIRWFSHLGCRFRVIAYGDASVAGRIREVFKAHDTEFEDLGTYDVPYTKEHHYEVMRAAHNEGKWAFFLDLDEFPWITPEQLIQVRRDGSPLIGWPVDRTTHDGTLPVTNRNIPLEVQYPYGFQFDRQFHLHSSCIYVADNKVPADHYVENCDQGRKTMAELVKHAVEVHRFSWNDRLPIRARQRLRELKQGENYDPHGEVYWTALLEHLKWHQGVCPSIISFVGARLGI